LKFTVSTVPLATVLPPESLVEAETNIVPAAAAGLENANISAAIAKTVENARRAPRSAADRDVCLVRVRRARSLTGVIVAALRLVLPGNVPPPTRNFCRDIG
jgi:hypothetical protein